MDNRLPEDRYFSVMNKIRDKLCKEDKQCKVENAGFHGSIELLEKIEEKGVFITPDQPVESVKNVTKLVFTCGQCHWDSCQFYMENENMTKYDLMTGYALDPPYLWVRHTWLVDKKDDKIKETATEALGQILIRSKYYGYRLPIEEAVSFCKSVPAPSYTNKNVFIPINKS